MALYFYENYVKFFNFEIIYKFDDSSVYRWIKWAKAALIMEFKGTINIKFLENNRYQLINVTDALYKDLKIAECKKNIILKKHSK